MRVLLIGTSSGRLDCLAEAISSSSNSHLFVLTNYTNPSLCQKGLVTVGPTTDPDFVEHWAEFLHWPQTMAIISDEAPLAAGIVDRLIRMDIPTVGPTQALARIETSKIYARNLIDRFNIGVNPLWGSFGPHSSIGDLTDWMHGLGEFVVKPDGITGGKGVRVQGDHFSTHDEGLNYALELVKGGGSLIIEEKLTGIEFSLMSLCGDACIPTFPIHDHKRLLTGDRGPNTGGMGSFAGKLDENRVLVPQEHLKRAIEVNERVATALETDNSQPYRGVLYGNYIVSPNGLRLIEFNARYGDPEIMNLLPVLDMDFVDLSWTMANGRLTESDRLIFTEQSSVVKYLVPEGYPDDPARGMQIDLSGVQRRDGLHIYLGGLDAMTMTGSRTAAMVGIADTVAEAEAIAETACMEARGPLYHRSDIGTFPAPAIPANELGNPPDRVLP